MTQRNVLIEDGIILPQRIRQVFSESGQVRSHNAQYVQLADEFFSGERTVSLGGISFFILVCGESNFLYNMQTQGNRVCLRHEAPGQTLADFKALEYRVAFNPAHTEMGNLGKMYRRWEFLSKSRIKGLPRTCLFTTNVERHSPATSAMYCFENQKQRILHSKRNWPEDRSWIMDLIPI